MLGREFEGWWGRDGGEENVAEGEGKNGLINRRIRGGRVEGRWMSTDCKRLLNYARRKLMVTKMQTWRKLCGERLF
jgi:hypothetical protein